MPLPVRDHRRVYPVGCAQFAERLDSLDGIQGHSGLEFISVLSPFSTHILPPFFGSELTKSWLSYLSKKRGEPQPLSFFCP